MPPIISCRLFLTLTMIILTASPLQSELYNFWHYPGDGIERVVYAIAPCLQLGGGGGGGRGET